MGKLAWTRSEYPAPRPCRAFASTEVDPMQAPLHVEAQVAALRKEIVRGQQQLDWESLYADPMDRARAFLASVEWIEEQLEATERPVMTRHALDVEAEIRAATARPAPDPVRSEDERMAAAVAVLDAAFQAK